jgi:hypothetical protein
MRRLICIQTVAIIVSVLIGEKPNHTASIAWCRHSTGVWRLCERNIELTTPQVVPGRMAMLITLFLVLINIFNIVTTNSPNVEGMTAIAAWMLVCIFFVFGALGNQSLTHLTQSINHFPNFPVPSVRSLLIFFFLGNIEQELAFV